MVRIISSQRLIFLLFHSILPYSFFGVFFNHLFLISHCHLLTSLSPCGSSLPTLPASHASPAATEAAERLSGSRCKILCLWFIKVITFLFCFVLAFFRTSAMTAAFDLAHFESFCIQRLKHLCNTLFLWSFKAQYFFGYIMQLKSNGCMISMLSSSFNNVA